MILALFILSISLFERFNEHNQYRFFYETIYYYCKRYLQAYKLHHISFSEIASFNCMWTPDYNMHSIFDTHLPNKSFIVILNNFLQPSTILSNDRPVSVWYFYKNIYIHTVNLIILYLPYLLWLSMWSFWVISLCLTLMSNINIRNGWVYWIIFYM